MIRAIHPLPVSVFVIFLLCMKTSSLGSGSLSKDGKLMRCIEKEREALLVFKQRVGVETKHDILHSWKKEEENCCNWKGIGCDYLTGHVNCLYLSSFTSPISINSTTDSIDKLLLNLPYLNYLDLSNNLLGLAIPTFNGSLTKSILHHIRNHSKLQYLNLSSNFFDGPIPKFIGSLNSLRYLDLSNNYFSGVIPHELGNLSKLQYLDLGYNYILKGGENFKWSFNLSSLTHLDSSTIYFHHPSTWLSFSLRSLPYQKLEVSSDNLDGYLPTVFEHHSDLQFLDLSDNHLTGSLPNFTGFPSLRVINLSNNEFSGSVPDFTGCSSLQVLRLNNNQLEKWETQSSELPSSLNELDLSVNSIHGTISEVHLSNLSSLKYLRASFNSLTFKFSSEWFPHFQLSDLSLASCKLGPKFPNWIRNQRHLGHLDISNSQISDTIPNWFSNLSTVLYSLNLSSNKFRVGALSDNCMHFRGLLFLNLGHNKFSGRIPKSVGHLISLWTLILRNNKFHGELPASLRNCSRLGFVDFGLNKLSGTIPSWIGEDLPQLYALILKSNRFFGSLPYEICHLSNLHFLDLSINHISGTSPTCIDNLTAMIQKRIEIAEHIYSSEDSLVPIPGPQSICL
ncbi:hypothetical protein POM88_039913 [Heracleum sosnowskyi]|uniref:Leucine-rich repeat-containing N-terminal plant-type domain-containing protein n=1 Tax=Heracleum sosnowskyi TaxID=360622 RepID=A0AAD8M9B0_9APIA|nr:hypothetical protein POM88_039913 [Heracleum sosnowskyi]